MLLLWWLVPSYIRWRLSSLFFLSDLFIDDECAVGAGGSVSTADTTAFFFLLKRHDGDAGVIKKKGQLGGIGSSFSNKIKRVEIV